MLAYRLADVLAELNGGDKVDGGGGGEAERLEVGEQIPAAALHLQRGEDDGVAGTPESAEANANPFQFGFGRGAVATAE